MTDLAASRDVKGIYAEYDAAQMMIKALEQVNFYSLDTPEKRLEWDVAYDKAKARLFRAMAERSRLIQEMANE